jgi:hypothetical protein
MDVFSTTVVIKVCNFTRVNKRDIKLSLNGIKEFMYLNTSYTIGSIKKDGFIIFFSIGNILEEGFIGINKIIMIRNKHFSSRSLSGKRMFSFIK